MQSYVNNLGVEWHVNLPMAPWDGGFFECLVISVKELLRKELKCYRSPYEELQTVLFEIECILNNRPIMYYYSMDIEPCLTPNHLLYGRTLTLSNTDMNDINYNTINPILEPQKLNNIVNHFWNRWQKGYLCNLTETHKLNKLQTTLPVIEVNDIVKVHVDKLPRSQWKLGLVTVQANTKPKREAAVISNFVHRTGLFWGDCTKISGKPFRNLKFISLNSSSEECVQHRHVYSIFRLKICSSFITKHIFSHHKN